MVSLSQVDVPVYTAGTEVKPSQIAKQGLEEARKKNIDVVIVDTAGRLQVVSLIFFYNILYIFKIISRLLIFSARKTFLKY